MRAGADVIYQATFARDGWRGRADFLIRVEEPSPGLGAWSYEPGTRSSPASAKPAAVLQLPSTRRRSQRSRAGCRSGSTSSPARMIVETYRPGDFSAFLRTAQRRLRTYTSPQPPDIYPWPCGHCSRCDYIPVCRKRWEDDDHLTLVASIRRDQIEKLERRRRHDPDWPRGVAADPSRAPRRAADARRAARPGRRSSSTAAAPTSSPTACSSRRTSAGSASCRRPRPATSSSTWRATRSSRPPAGSSSCSACSGASPTASTTYTAVLGPRPRRRAEGVRGSSSTSSTQRLARAPRHARLPLRRLRAVDARAADGRARDPRGRGRRAAARRGARRPLPGRAPGPARRRPSYSLKEVEQLFFTRAAEVELGQRRGARASSAGSRTATSRASTRSRPTTRRTASRRSSCATGCSSSATRGRGRVRGRDPVRPPPERASGRRRPTRSSRRRPACATRCSRRRTAGDERWLQAQLLDYHRREARPGWWWYFRRLRDDRRGADRRRRGDRLAWSCGRSAARGRGAVARLDVHASRRSSTTSTPDDSGATRRRAARGWTVTELDNAAGTVVLKRGKSGRATSRCRRRSSPAARSTPRCSRRRCVAWRRRCSPGDGALPAPRSACCGASRRSGGALAPAAGARGAARARSTSSTSSYLVVQGPPGSGKTYRGARLITAPVAAGTAGRGRRAEPQGDPQPARRGRARGRPRKALDFKGVKQRRRATRATHISDGRRSTTFDDPRGHCWSPARPGCSRATSSTASSTRWSSTRPASSRLADALAMRHRGAATRPARRPAAARPGHPGRPPARAPALGARAPARRRTRRSPRTRALPRADAADAPRRLPLRLRGVLRGPARLDRRVRRAHDLGRRRASAGSRSSTRATASSRRRRPTRSPREIERLLGQHVHATRTASGRSRHDDVMVVAPYNAQVRLLRERAARAASRSARSTSSRAARPPVVFYSMAISSGEDVPRGLDFLFSRNRLNVAVSRAQCLAYVVCSPGLLEVDCRTVEQMRLANALCRFAELVSDSVREQTSSTILSVAAPSPRRRARGMRVPRGLGRRRRTPSRRGPSGARRSERHGGRADLHAADAAGHARVDRGDPRRHCERMFGRTRAARIRQRVRHHKDAVRAIAPRHTGQKTPQAETDVSWRQTLMAITPRSVCRTVRSCSEPRMS